ncbi:hypothetical protein B1692_07855, partial [Geobacillus thermoleovorans]
RRSGSNNLRLRDCKSLQAKNICPSRRPAGLSFSVLSSFGQSGLRFSFALRFVQFSRNDSYYYKQSFKNVNY